MFSNESNGEHGETGGFIQEGNTTQNESKVYEGDSSIEAMQIAEAEAI